jgi:hypothetical protein
MACYEGHCVLTCDDICGLVDVDRRVMFIREHETFICPSDERTSAQKRTHARARAHTHTHTHTYINMYPRQHDASSLHLLKPNRYIRTTRFNIQKFCMLITLHLHVLYGSQNKQ